MCSAANTGNTTGGNTGTGWLKRSGWTVLTVGLLGSSSSLGAVPSGSPLVSPRDAVYVFIDRCIARGLLPPDVALTKPLTRAEVGRLLLDVAFRRPELDDRVLEADLDYYLREFAWDIRQSGLPTEPSGRTLRPVDYSPATALDNPHRHLSAVYTDGFIFLIDPVAWVRTDANSNETVLRRGSGIQFRGAAFGAVGFHFRFVDHTESGRSPYLDRTALLEDHAGYVGPLRGGKSTYYDLAEAGLTLNWKWGGVFFGKEHAQWGPSRDVSLLLGATGPSFDQMRWTFRPVERVRFTYLLGSLQPWDSPGDTLYRTELGWTRLRSASKWIAAHRLEYRPWRRVVLAVAEAVIWGDRGLQAAYVNPLNFYYSAQHNAGDQDNVLMAGEVSLGWGRHGRFYAEILLDDLTTSRLNSDYAGNKWGLTAGIISGDLGVPGLETAGEYTRLQPFVYTHFYPVNRYTHWTSSLGADLPPNSDRLRWRLTHRPHRSLQAQLVMDFNRRGSLGSDLSQTLPPNSATDIGFLDAVRRNWTEMDLSLAWEPLTGLNLGAGRITGDYGSALENRWYLYAAYRY